MTKTKMITVDPKALETLGLKASGILPAVDMTKVAIDNCEFVYRAGDPTITLHQQRQLLMAIQEQLNVVYKQLDEVAFELLNCEETLVTSEHGHNPRTASKNERG